MRLINCNFKMDGGPSNGERRHRGRVWRLSAVFIATAGASQAQGLEGLRDIHGPVAYPISWWGIVLGVALGLIALGGCGVWYRRFRRRSTPQIAVVQEPPWQIAYEQLEALKQQDLIAQGAFHLFYSRLSEIVRHYLSARFSIRAPEMTTEEFLIFLNRSLELTEAHKKALREFSVSCDLVKFAKHAPLIEDALASFDLALHLVNETQENSPAQGDGA